MRQMIVMYNLAEHQIQEQFEHWLNEVDIPAYAEMTSMRNPMYFRTDALLGEDKPAPFKYVIIIEMDSESLVEEEMADPKWAGFIQDIEGRITDAHYIVADRIA